MPGIYVFSDEVLDRIFTFYQTFEGILYANINGVVVLLDNGTKVKTVGLSGWAIALIAIGCVVTIIMIFFGLQRCCRPSRSGYDKLM
jgi:hypothetical protein